MRRREFEGVRAGLSKSRQPTTSGKLAVRALAALVAAAILPGCFILHRHRGQALDTSVTPGTQPDKVLFEKSLNEIAHGRYDVGRLTLQALINTYPDSEYLAKAKLAIADSYYREGGISGLTQAELEYKDFITFFPTAPEAPEAQFRAGMAHFRLMGKSDRDTTEAREAEAEFKQFLLKYPDNPLMPRVKGRLREVQEVLAQGDYEIARFYFMKGDMPAARGRFQDIADQYPSFSQGDRATWYLGQALERMHKPNDAAVCYARLITDYPLSDSVDDAKERLAALHKPIPHPTDAMLARARADMEVERRHHRDLLSKLGGAMSSTPDLSATRHGPVELGGTPGGIEEAKKSPTNPSGVGAVIAQPIDDSAGSDPNDPAPAANGTTPSSPQNSHTAVDNNATTKSEATSQNSSSEAAAPQKKPGKLHLFKKLIPF